MGIKSFKPYTPGRRHMTVSTFEEITTSKPEKSLLAPLKKHGGRNQQGRLTVRHQGGGHKRRYRIIDFKRNKDGIPAKVATIEYDPNRSARIALLHYADGEKRYIIAPNGLKVGDKVESGAEADIKTKAGNLFVVLVPPRNLWLKRATTRQSECLPAKFASSILIAALLSGKSAISITKILQSVKRVARVGLEFVRQIAASL